MLAGLQGSGKTTLAAKLALWLKGQGNTPMLVAADLQRPNAVQQLQVLGEQAGVPVYAPFPGNGVGDPVAAARDSLEEARRRQQNMVIIDTAGRLGVDAEMMAQAVAIRDATQPDEILFVVDAMIGQDAVATAQAFLDGVGYDGVVLTKLDGDARGGAALSIVELTGRPIMFASSGEKLEDFDMFHPDRMASRILDLGDLLTLIEQAEKAFDAEQTAGLAGRLASGEGFTLEDFVEQLSMVRKLGPIGNILGMLPGAGRHRELLEQVNDKDLDRAEAIVRSMTPEERRNPKIINGSRRARIAKGSGVAIGEVSQLVTNFFEGQKQMKAMFSGGIPGMPPMPGLGAARRAAGKKARKKTSKKKGPRSGDPRRAAEIARGGGGQGGGPGAPAPGGLGGAGGLGGLPGGGLPEGFPESLADGLANLPPGLNFPSPSQGNIPAAFRGGNKRKKKLAGQVPIRGAARGRCRWCRLRRRSCPRGSAARGRNAAPGRPGSGGCAGRRRRRSPPPVRAGRRRSRSPGGLPARAAVAVCQVSSSSVSPLNVLPSMTKPPVEGSRAPRCRLDSQPRRRPCPHSTASTTRSSVCRGLTLIHPAPRRPAAYGVASDLTTTPSWPCAIASPKKAVASSAEEVTRRGMSRSGGDGPGQRGVPVLVFGVDQVGAFQVEGVEQEHRKRDRRAPAVQAGGAGRRVLERQRPAVLAQRDQLAVEDRGRTAGACPAPRPPRAAGP